MRSEDLCTQELWRAHHVQVNRVYDPYEPLLQKAWKRQILPVMGPEQPHNVTFTVQGLSECSTLHITVGPALLEDFQARLAKHLE